MAKVEALLAKMRENPKGVSFSDLAKVCQHYFGDHRSRGSHYVYKTP